MILVFDLETNGLYQEADTLWCISLKDISEGSVSPVESFSIEWVKAGTRKIEDGLKRLSEASTLIGHNIINFDLPVLKKLYGWKPSPNTKIIDTLVLSTLYNPDRKAPSKLKPTKRHSLEAWGYRVGRGKPDHEDWSEFSMEMLHRNREDVEINCLTYEMLQMEAEGWDWEEAEELEHKIAEIITKQEHNGVLFNVEKSNDYSRELQQLVREIDDELLPRLPHRIKPRGAPVLEPFTKTGEYTKKYREDISYCSGPFCRITIEQFDLGSPNQVKQYLLDNGWKPDEWNYSKTTGERTSPKLSGNFDGIEGDLPQKVKRRISLLKRKSLIEGWLENVREDGRISAGAFPCGTNTGRMRHRTVVNVPKANTYTEEDVEEGRATSDQLGSLIWGIDHQKDLFGTQMRSLFCVKPDSDYVMVGHDAKGIELRMLAHYMNDPDYIEAILNGDIHTYNQKTAGLATRDLAKSVIYALIYGSGDAKLGSVMGGSKRDGSTARRKLLESVPALKRLDESVKRSARRGYLRGIDGRKVWMRRYEDGSVASHKALNALLQSAAAIVMKKSTHILWNELVPQNKVRAIKVLDMHDEVQAEVYKDDVELYSKLAVQSLQQAGEYFGVRIPIDADVKVGMNWAETH